jgi:hypothetical protein
MWNRDCYHLSGTYCSWNCAKSDSIAKTKTGSFPKNATALALFAFQISFRGRNCPQKSRLHTPGCHCYSRFTGVLQAYNKETLQAFGGSTTIDQFRRGFLTIESYEWITRFYEPRELLRDPPVKKEYLYTLKPLRRMKFLEAEEEDEDPVVLIQRRVF